MIKPIESKIYWFSENDFIDLLIKWWSAIFGTPIQTLLDVKSSSYDFQPSRFLALWMVIASPG